MKSIALAAFFISDHLESAFGDQGAGRLAWQSGLFDGFGHQVNENLSPQQLLDSKVCQLLMAAPGKRCWLMYILRSAFWARR